jgi:hypothetical protein
MSEQEEMDLTEEQELDFDERGLWTHEHRPEWGAAVLVDTTAQHMVYQFQDGIMRRFRRDFMHMFAPLERSETARESILERLQEKHHESLEVHRQRTVPLKPPLMEFDAQVAVFRSFYPGGFTDEEYLRNWRREDGRKLKRHLDPDIVRAKTLLGKATLTTLIEEGRHEDVHDALVAVFKRTALIIPSKELRPLQELEGVHHEALAAGLFDLLHGEGRYSDRLRDYILVLDRLKLPITWGMVTVPGGLVSPKTRLCPRRSVFRVQARTLRLRTVIRSSPTPRSYRSAMRIARRVSEALTERGLVPRDLLDVRIFIWETLRPRGIAQLAALQKPQQRAS